MKFMFTKLGKHLTSSVEVREGSKAILVVPVEDY